MELLGNIALGVVFIALTIMAIILAIITVLVSINLAKMIIESIKGEW